MFLHGRGRAGNKSNTNGAFYAALRAQGKRAPVVVFPNGGDHSYFHARGSGDWARYVLDEVIPEAVERFGADADRVAIGGISMGGFGAFAIARRRPSEFCAVGGHSAAFWLRSGDTARGVRRRRRLRPQRPHRPRPDARARAMGPRSPVAGWGHRRSVRVVGRAARLRAGHPHAPLVRRAPRRLLAAPLQALPTLLHRRSRRLLSRLARDVGHDARALPVGPGDGVAHARFRQEGAHVAADAHGSDVIGGARRPLPDQPSLVP